MNFIFYHNIYPLCNYHNRYDSTNHYNNHNHNLLFLSNFYRLIQNIIYLYQNNCLILSLNHFQFFCITHILFTNSFSLLIILIS